MSLLKTLRTLLTEKKNGTYKYGCVMLHGKVEKSDWDKIQSFIEDDEVYEGDNQGREDEPHITLLYGLHNDIEDDKVKEIVETFDPVEIELGEVGIFENDDFDVVKFSIEDKNLKAYNKKLKELPYTNDYPIYKAHMTIAYVEKGKGKEIQKRYDDMKPKSLLANKIKYSKAEGKPIYYNLKKDS